MALGLGSALRARPKSEDLETFWHNSPNSLRQDGGGSVRPVPVQAGSGSHRFRFTPVRKKVLLRKKQKIVKNSKWGKTMPIV